MADNWLFINKNARNVADMKKGIPTPKLAYVSDIEENHNDITD